MIYESAIHAALEEAPHIRDVSGILPAGNQVKSTLFVPTAAELGILLNELHLVLGGVPDQDRLTNLVRHEGHHQKAWNEIGSVATRFGLQIFNYDGSSRSVNYLPFLQASHSGDVQFTPLELASAAAHPIAPSEHDIVQIIGYGFESVEHVAEQAVANNRQGLKYVPVPLSSKGC